MPTVFGAELTLAPRSPGFAGDSGLPASPRTGIPDPPGSHLVVLARDPVGYSRLACAITEGHLAGGEKGRPRHDLDRLAELAGGHFLVLTGCRKGAVPTALVEAGPVAAARELDRLVERFGRESLVVELFDHDDPARLGPQRCPCCPGGAERPRHRRHERCSPRPARGPPPRLGARFGPLGTPPRRARWLAARRRSGLFALGGRAGQALRPLSGSRRACRRARAVRALSTSTSSPPSFPIFPCRRPERDDLPAPARRRGSDPALRPSPARTRAGGMAPAGARVGDDRGVGLRRLLPRRLGHRRVLPALGDLLPGPGFGGELGCVLRARDHQCRCRRPRPFVRAVPVARARRAARHRRGHRERAARGGDPVRLRALRPRASGARGRRRELPGPLSRAGRRQGSRPLARPGRRLGAAHRSVGFTRRRPPLDRAAPKGPLDVVERRRRRRGRPARAENRDR